MPEFVRCDHKIVAHLTLSLAEEGLYLGKALLFRSTTSVSDEDADRLLALLTIAFQREISPDVVRHVEAATAFWARGDKAVANLRLLYARLPTTSATTPEKRLRQAEFCLDNGMSTSALMTELGFAYPNQSLCKYKEDQPRVPAGSGPISGR